MEPILQKPITSREVILATVGSASGAGAAITLWTLVNKLSAEQIVALAKDLGGYFLLAAGLLLLGATLGRDFVRVQREQALALGRLSTAVETIAGQDNPRLEGIEGSLGLLHRKVDRLLEDQPAKGG